MSREQLVLQIEDTKQAIKRTQSIRCKNDLSKHLKRMLRELRDYDRFQQEAQNARV